MASVCRLSLIAVLATSACAMSEQAKRINACVKALPVLEQESLQDHRAVANVEGESPDELTRNACEQGAEAVVAYRREELTNYTIYTPMVVYTGTAVRRGRVPRPVEPKRRVPRSITGLVAAGLDAAANSDPPATSSKPIRATRSMSDLKRGAEVRVRAPDIFNGRRTGELLAVYSSQIEVRIGRSRTKIPLVAIETLELKHASAFNLTTSLSAGIGAVAGSLIGFIVAPLFSSRVACSGPNCDNQGSGSAARFGAVTGSILGLVAGMAIGNRLRSDQWESVALPALSGP